MPAIHYNRGQIRDIFADADARLPAPTSPTNRAVLADAARAHLRRTVPVGPGRVSGANFAIADTGTLVSSSPRATAGCA